MWSPSPQVAQAASCGARPAASSSFSRKASWRAGVAFAGFASSSARYVHSRLKTSGCGSPESKIRPTASHARAAPSSASAFVRSRAYGATVCALVTVSRSLRPSCRPSSIRKKGSRRPPKRLLERRTPLAIAPIRPRIGV